MDKISKNCNVTTNTKLKVEIIKGSFSSKNKTIPKDIRALLHIGGFAISKLKLFKLMSYHVKAKLSRFIWFSASG